MDQRIILFRGMNTGGVRAPVAEQRAMAAEMGLGNPRTLLASGNLVVESDRDPARLEGEVEAAMEARFGLKVAVMVRTPEDWRSLIAANPFGSEAAAEPSKVLAMVMKAGVKADALEACRALAEGGGSGSRRWATSSTSGSRRVRADRRWRRRPRPACWAWERAATGTRC